jgi:predicted PurR-regulated permease PerM
MSETQQFLALMAVFTGLVAMTLVVVACLAFSVWRSLRNLNSRATEFLDHWQPVATSTQESVEEFAEQSGELLSRLNRLSALLEKQALQADTVIEDFAQAAQRNIAHVDSTLQATLERVNAATAALEQAVQLPATKVRALAAGVAAALRHLSQSRQQEPDRISTDEEMFI